MTTNEIPLDPTSTQARKRFLPSVSEVVRLVAQGDPSADPAQVFKAARYVCSEELARVKQGGAAAPAEELASRVHEILRKGYPPPSGARPEAAPAQPPSPPSAPSIRTPSGTSDDPFSETTGALDLRWEPDEREPFEEGAPAPPPGSPAPAAEPFELAATPPPPPAPFLLEDVARQDEERAGAMEKGEESGRGIPGEETLTRLEREAAELPLASVFPRAAAHAPTEPLPPLRFGGAAAGAPAAAEDQAPTEAPPGEEAPPRRPDWDRPFLPERVPFQTPEPPQRAPRLLVAAGSVVVLLAVAGVAWVYLGGGKLPSVPFLSGGAPKPTTSPVPYLPASAETEVAPEPTAVTVLVPTELPVPTPVAPAPTAVPAPAATVAPLAVATRVPPAPAPAAETPSPVPVTRVASRPTEPAPEAPAAGSVPPARPAEGAGSLPRQNRPASLVSPDWAGKEPAFVLHFASYRDRALAEKDAQKLARSHGRPAFALEVDLGAKGTYFRSVLSGFASGEEALAFREELSAGGATGVGFVYRVTGK
ncbi:MAG: SPOR domain-containing protein [Acidobacteria bacterium]|nr:MAG: SPOR domain-containing protein [Acidobacteriota bacterium]